MIHFENPVYKHSATHLVMSWSYCSRTKPGCFLKGLFLWKTHFSVSSSLIYFSFLFLGSARVILNMKLAIRQTDFSVKASSLHYWLISIHLLANRKKKTLTSTTKKILSHSWDFWLILRRDFSVMQSCVLLLLSTKCCTLLCTRSEVLCS